MTDPTYYKIIDLAHLTRFKSKQDQYNLATFLGIHGTADQAQKLVNTADAGNATTPIYFSNGVPVALSYTIQKSVPADAVFTDTTYDPVVSGSETPGLMTGADKAKLDGIAAGAEVNQNAFSSISVGADTVTADSKTDSFTLTAGSNVQMSVSGDAITVSATDTTYSDVVADQTGAIESGLMTSADKYKLDNIEAGGEVNVLEGVQVNGTDLAIDANKKVNVTVASGTTGVGTIKVNGTDIAVYGLGDAAAAGLATSIADGEAGLASGDQVYDAINTALASALIYKGVKATVADLPSTGQKVGDLWHVTADNGEYAWNGKGWDELGSVLDLSNYVQFSDITLADNADIDSLFSAASE